MPPRFYNGKTWTDVTPEKKKAPTEQPKEKKNLLSFLRRRPSPSSNTKDETPVPPVIDGDGKILVTIPSFRDGQECGEALLDLFEKAKNPDSIVVSLVEQQNENETYCVESYCKAAANIDVIRRTEYRKGEFSVLSDEFGKAQCPRIDQIRVVRIHEAAAKGPPWARAMGRRSVGNEEFCMHASTHTTFAGHWDAKARTEWLAANNEFAILSNPPKPVGTQGKHVVPRTCGVEFLDEEHLPHYDAHPEGKVEKLQAPLLSHTWSPGFSFGKCHMEEAAPSDGFLPYVSSDIEAFARYARMWTRGYDVYTPTQNIVFKKVFSNPHKLEWINNSYGEKKVVQMKSLRRIRSYLGISLHADEAFFEKVDNLGIYGIGTRRTLQQLNEFVGIDLAEMDSRDPDAPCGNFEWVPYNSDISPMDNFYSNPDDLDPQPEFPLRTNLTFDKYSYAASMMEDLDDADAPRSASSTQSLPQNISPLDARRVPYGTMFFFWIVGLALWYQVFAVSTTASGAERKRKKKKNKSK